ncbi:MAG: DUF881 domain-containing protein [Eubacteriales bacterium]|nr:DUF881 domain-containing protein [Eubacteriales bacterium]
MSSTRRLGEKLGLALLLFVLGFLLAIQLKASANGRISYLGDDLALRKMKEELDGLRVKNAELLEEINEEKRYLSKLLEAKENNEVNDAKLRSDYENALTYAGLTDVKGPGAIVIIRGNRDQSIKAASLSLLINEFKAGGAQAMAVNGERIVALSEIRGTGADDQSIVVNGTQVSPNYTYEVRIIDRQENIENVWRVLQPMVDEFRANGMTVSIQYYQTIQIPALSTDSPAYRNALLQSQDS